MKKMYLVSIEAICVSLLIFMPIFGIKSLPPLVWAQTTNTTTTPTSSDSFQVFPAESVPYNLTYGDWSARWWQWVIYIPANINPLLDQTGENCDANQSGPVWFLTGTFGGPAERRCIIPEHKAIFFPIVNVYASYVENPLIKTESELLAFIKPALDGVIVLEATVDGVKLENLENYRVQSPLFNVSYPENNLGGVPPGPSQAISDGYWLMLYPLGAGEHTIHFRGGIVDPTVTGAINFITDVTYHLTVSNTTATQTSERLEGNTTTDATITTDVAN
jgi:hypothetical protein